MCEPTTLAIMSIATTLVTGAVVAKNQKNEGEYNAAVAEQNRRLANQRADDANALGARESQQQAWRQRAIIGQQRAAIAANNLDPTLGTPADILGETAMFGEVDQQSIRLNAARAAWGHQTDATNFGNQGAMSRWQGNTASRMTILGTLGRAFTQGANAFGTGRGVSVKDNGSAAFGTYAPAGGGGTAIGFGRY